MEAIANAAASDAVRELRLTRIFNAPRELVFAAWTDPRQIAKWWGPRGFSAPVCELDARVGGAIRIDMQGPDGTVFPMGGEVKELDPPRRLVFSAGAMPQADGGWGFENMNTVTFSEEAGGTRVDLHVEVLYANPEAAPALAGMREGWGQTLDRLGEFVGDRAAREIVLSRVYDAPVELLWEVFTDHKHTDQWWGPTGFRNTTTHQDVRVGGRWLHVMHGPDGRDYPNRQTYLAVDRPRQLVYEHGWDDDNIPPLCISTVTFTDLGDGKSEVEMRMTFASVEERERVAEEHGAIEGGKQTMARLADYVSQITTNGGS